MNPGDWSDLIDSWRALNAACTSVKDFQMQRSNAPRRAMVFGSRLI
jgi:hypothetical protein